MAAPTPVPGKPCRYCGTEIPPGAAKCPMCWEPAGWRWWRRLLRRGIFYGLLIVGLVVGGFRAWDFFNHGVYAMQELEDVKTALESVQRDCATRVSCPPQVAQAKALYEKARQEHLDGRHAQAAKDAAAARELIRDLPKEIAAPVAPPPAAAGTAGPAGPQLVAIAAGEFVMGAFDAGSDEKPAHTISLGGYSLMPREVTVEEYQRYADEARQAPPQQPAWSTPKHPVVLVTWQEAKAFCEHYGLRLPTEAEWERAARCGSAKDHVGEGGAAGLDRFAWHKGDSQGTAHPAGTKAASACLLYDIFGNAAEWTADWYAPDYYSGSPASNPTGPGQGDDRVVRGGAFDTPAQDLRAGARDRFSPDSGRENLGFRCAR